MSKHTLEQLLGSRIRLKVLRFLYRNQTLPFEIAVLAKKIQESKVLVAKEIKELKSLGLIRIKH